MRDFILPPRRKRDLRPSGTLSQPIRTDVSGQLIRLIFKGQEIQEENFLPGYRDP